MKRRLIVFLVAALLAGCLSGARAETGENGASGEALTAFRAFSESAAGKYLCWREDDVAVLELVPAFGRLFASVAYYYEDCLYSYYAVCLQPDDLTQAALRAGNSETSFALNARSHSNMSYAGAYWPDEEKWRLTLTADGLVLADLLNGGESAYLRADDAPSVLCYGPEEAAMRYGAGTEGVPEALAGAWCATWRVNGEDSVARVSIGADGCLTMLLSGGAERPPMLLRGGCVIEAAGEGAWTLRYLMSGLSSGTMPYEGGAVLSVDGDELHVSALEGEDSLLLPEGEAAVSYRRGADPLTLAWMTLANERDGQKFFDVEVRDPFDGSGEYLTVMKDGSTLFGWSSAMNTLDKLTLWRTIRSGRPLPVLYQARWGVVETLLLLGDIAENTDLLTLRAPFFPALNDYCEAVDDGERQGGEARVYFDESGEPTLWLSNQTDYPVQRDMTARIVRRVGGEFTAVDDEQNQVTFVIRPYGWMEILEQRLSFATHGFPGFGSRYFCAEE